MSDISNNQTPAKDVQKEVMNLLEELRTQKSLDPLKRLFWSELSYDRVNQPLPLADLPTELSQNLLHDSLLLASGGEDEGFKVIYIHLKDEQLLLTLERPIITKLLNKYLDALFIFSNQSLSKWHFVNVKSETQQAKRHLFRRITIGPEERLRTASERLASLDLTNKGKIHSLYVRQYHEEAFDVEAITKKFYDNYKIVFQILQKDLEKQTNDQDWAHDYALQFLNRCMFLYFIQRKGWLGEDREFLQTFWRSYSDLPHELDTFFDKWLKVLFFEAFNNNFLHQRQYFPKEINAILALAPYLNGGLFSPNPLDSQYTFTISDARFEQVFTFLQSYNFTISEDSPLDQEVAVDPEMIGRVYENLVNVSTELDERGDAGIFYTPRTEIDLMCRLSLVNYLSNHLPDVSKDRLYDFVFAVEPEEVIAADQALQQSNVWDRLSGLLQVVTVVDPACGSGAFLVGMLYVLNDLQKRTSTRPQTDYERKRNIISKNIYGVDVMEWAAHIAELRLWLTLIVDANFSLEDLHVRRDPLLPHLTFKVRYGDSLIQEIGSIKFSHMQITSGISAILRRSLTTLKDEKRKFYFNDPTCVFKSREDAIQEEILLFRAIINERRVAINNSLIAQRNTATQDALIGSTHKTPEDRAREKNIEVLEAEKQQLEAASNALISPKQVPFVWDISFVEVMHGGDNNGFDIVIGNPPYVRQEKIADPRSRRTDVPEENRKAYKRKLAQMVAQDYPDFFKFGTGAAGSEINAQSDLYVYFYLHGLRLLNASGTFCFITSNSWLDVQYGADLQEFLLKYCQIKMVLDNQVKRSFATAAVNTVITLFSAPKEKPTEQAIDNLACFILFTVDFKDVLSSEVFKTIERTQQRTTTPLYRVNPVSQQALLVDGSQEPEEPAPKSNGKAVARPLVQIARYVGNKWGGKYLRAPDIYWTLLEKGKGKLVRLGDIAEVRFGIKTGANEFFYLDEAKAKQWNIEEEFLQPVIKSPRECRSILIDPTALKTRLFLCHKAREALKGTAALEYIKWGEKQGFQNRPSCRGRARWWDLGERRSPNLGFNYLIDSTARTLYAPHGCYFSDNFQEIDIATQNVASLCVSLNSTIFQLMVNVEGRSNFGDGLLKIQTYEVSNLLCVDPSTIKLNDSNIFSSTSWDVLSSSADRRTLDNIVFDALNLLQSEREAVYEAVKELVDSRLTKARSLKVLQEQSRRLKAVEDTLGIWMGLPPEEEESRYA